MLFWVERDFGRTRPQPHKAYKVEGWPEKPMPDARSPVPPFLRSSIRPFEIALVVKLSFAVCSS